MSPYKAKNRLQTFLIYMLMFIVIIAIGVLIENS